MAAASAPSAGNLQPWELIVIKSKENKNRLARAALDQWFIAEAPVVVVICADVPRTSMRYGKRGESLYCIQDCAAACQNLLLAAHALGYGTCWIGAFDDVAVSSILGLPKSVRPLAIVPIGRPAEKPSPPRRISLGRLVHEERYQGEQPTKE